ncbi:methyl-accepting chemotaxis sensory transducer [Thiorhodococcus drewsii AZ1]|uniref:Methyl-accepting chemotaxis sensory transducer n=1 Tax=Thiorhodococcus drewsii AZ1 TaxID=765913 RepID=G2E846_9GAMM|nr:methyl-accepting chemotaxis protein [Thiorhodococcus drewsii]EGV27728.1 methyl-accepting chemotaxis sensory transducer [Thiorhodococcus drewsii AZ1]
MLRALSLKRRLMLIVTLSGGFFILLGLFSLQWVKSRLTEDIIADCAQTLRLTLEERLLAKQDVGIASSVALAQSPKIIELFGQTSREQGIEELRRITRLYRESTKYHNLRFHLHTADGHSLLRSWAPESFGDDLRGRATMRRMLEKKQPFALLDLSPLGVNIHGFAPVFDGDRYLGSLEVIQGVSSVSRDFQADGLNYVMLLDARLRTANPALAKNTRIGDYILAKDKWFNDKALAFVRGIDLALLDQSATFVTSGWLVVSAPVVDAEGKRIGTHLIGEPLEFVEKRTAAATQIAWVLIAILILLMLGLSVVIGWTVNRYVARPIKRAVARLGHMENDLRLRIEIERDDEIGALFKALNHHTETLHSIIQEVRLTANELDDSAVQLLNASEQTVDMARSQQQETDQIASASTEMAASAHKVAQHAESTRNLLQETETHTSEGIREVAETSESIDRLSAQMRDMEPVIKRLEEGSANIGQVIETIAGIAEQTNLLALNAAIEAARAGEAGRGFAVVADEVRNLSNRTQESTREIAAIVSGLQKATHQVAEAIDESSAQAHACVSQAAEAGKALEAIRASVGGVNDMGEQIATAAHEQSAVAVEISRSMNRINQLAEQSSQAMEQGGQINRTLVERSKALETLVQRFNL